MRHYLVTVDDKEYNITIDTRSGSYRINCNDQEISADATFLGESRSLLIVDGHSYEVDVRGNGYDSSQVVLLRGMEIPVQIEDYNLAQLRKTAGMGSAAKIQKDVRAAMPGLILEVKVKPGEHVVAGQPLLVVEAMKMENIIKAVGDGVIKSVAVTKGDSIDKGDKMLEFE